MSVEDWNLQYWSTNHWKAAEEKLHAEETTTGYNPERHQLFAALGLVRPESCRVAIVGQDPYPRREYCTGVAFSVPRSIRPNEYPPTLRNIFQEYTDDLGYPTPTHGDLTQWCEQGVLLWNAYPSCATGKPGSHHWAEWEILTREIMEKLNGLGLARFVFLGRVSSACGEGISPLRCRFLPHPSPLSARKGFLGSKLFTNINSSLISSGQPPINWRLT